MKESRCEKCDRFGKSDILGKPQCFSCPDFTISDFTHRVLVSVNNGDLEADENILADLNLFAQGKFTPTIKKQQDSFLDKTAIWLVSKTGTMAFWFMCMISLAVPVAIPSLLEVFN